MTGLDCTDADLVPVYKSTPIIEQIGDLMPKFKKFEQKVQVLSNGDQHCLLRFSVRKYDEDKGHHLSYGYCTTTLDILSKNLEFRMDLHD